MSGKVKFYNKPIFIITLVLLVSCIWAVFFGQGLTPTPIDTPTPTLTNTPAPTLTPTDTPIPTRRGHISDLTAEGAIRVSPSGNGIDSIELDLENLVEEILQVEIPAGTYFVAQNPYNQNMVVTRSEVVVLDPGEFISTMLEAACANIERDVPSEGAGFTIYPSGSKDLTNLLAVLDNADIPYDVKQAAIWIVTDDADFADLGTLVVQRSVYDAVRVISEQAAAQAMKLVDETGGIDITTRRIWADRRFIAKGADPELVEWIKQREQ
jgi:hypothetical protein